MSLNLEWFADKWLRANTMDSAQHAHQRPRLLSLLAEVAHEARREGMYAAARIADYRFVLNDSIEGETDEATDIGTGVRGTAAFHRAFECKCIAADIRAEAGPASGEGTP